MDAIILCKQTWSISRWYDIERYPIDKNKYIILKYLKPESDENK